MASGLSADGIDRRIASGQWSRVRPGVFALWTPQGEDSLLLQRLMAAALWLGDGSGVSHRAACVLWTLDGVRRAPLEFVTTSRKRADPRTVVHYLRSLPAGDLTTCRGIPVTTVARTLVDSASVLSPAALELAIESALRKSLVDRAEIRAALERSPIRSRGRGTIRSLVGDDSLPNLESALEVLVWQLLRTAGLPPPVRQFEIRDDRGRFIARPDMAFPHARVAIEADGFRYHSTPGDLERDRSRQNAIMRAGWAMYRTKWADVTRDPERVAREIAELVVARSLKA